MSFQDDVQDDLENVFYRTGSGEFERSAAYTPVTGSPDTLDGEFIDITELDRNEVEVGERGSQPTFSCATSNVPNAAHGDLFVIESATYKTVGVDKNNLSKTTTFILEKQ